MCRKALLGLEFGTPPPAKLSIHAGFSPVAWRKSKWGEDCEWSEFRLQGVVNIAVGTLRFAHPTDIVGVETTNYFF